MKAAVCTENGMVVHNIPTPDIKPNHVRVKVLAGGLNRRDYYISIGKYAKIQLPCVLGSDACGIVTEAPNNPELLDKRVVIDPSLEWGTNPKAQSTSFHILGMPTQGTLAEEVVVPTENVHLAPVHLTDTEAAALVLAGTTAYRALFTQAGCTSDSKVLITGAGGGVASWALLFAKALGCTTAVTTGNETKLNNLLADGADYGVLYSSEQWSKSLLGTIGSVDIVIDGTGGAQVNECLNLLSPGGTFVSYGATLGTVPELNMHRIFWKQLRVLGSTMGTRQDVQAMLSFVSRYKILPVIDSVMPIERIEDAFKRMADFSHTGNIVISI